MKLPKLFGRKKDDDDDFEDDFDPEDFDVEDLDDHLDDATSGDEDPAADEQPSGLNDTSDLEDVEELMVGGGDDVDADDDPFDDHDDDFDDDDFDDDDFDDEDEDDEGGGRVVLFAVIGAVVLLLGAVGGAGWWFFSGDESAPAPVVEPALENTPDRVQMAMPAAPGSLNANADGGLNALSPDAAVSPDNVVEALPAAEPPPESFTQDAIAPSEDAPAAQAPLNSLNNLNSLNEANAGGGGGGLVMAAVNPAALAAIPDLPTANDQSQALANAPISGLLQEIDGIGDVPRVGSNGIGSWQAYARPVPPDIQAPRVALLFEGVGLSRNGSLGVINKLPPEISLALSPYGRDLDDWVFRARLAGHEVFMSLPMESEDFPLEDAGPLALDTRVQVAENQRRLDTVMASASGYVGMVTFMGSRFTKAEGQLRQILASIGERGLMFVLGGSRSRNDASILAEEMGLVRATSEFYIDSTPSIQNVRESLDRLESIARDNGFAIGMARPYPVTIKSVMDWIATLEEKGIALVPLSSVAIVPSSGG